MFQNLTFLKHVGQPLKTVKKKFGGLSSTKNLRRRLSKSFDNGGFNPKRGSLSDAKKVQGKKLV